MALDTEGAKERLFRKSKEPIRSDDLNENKGAIPTPEATQQRVTDNESSPATPKWQQFDKVTVLLTSEQKEGVDRIAKKLMKFRSKELKGVEDKERITTNTIIRALIENFLIHEESLQLEVLVSEDEVKSWIWKAFK